MAMIWLDLWLLVIARGQSAVCTISSSTHTTKFGFIGIRAGSETEVIYNMWTDDNTLDDSLWNENVKVYFHFG